MNTHDEHVLISPSDPKWLEFIQTHAKANIFHHPAWLEVMHHCYGYSPSLLIIPDANGEICAGLPFMQISVPFLGHRWVSLPFSDYCNPLFRNDASVGTISAQLVRIFQNSKYHRIEARWELPASPQIQKNLQFVLHTIRLDPAPEQVAKKFKRTHLQNIHMAKERGVKVEFGDKLEHVKVFYNLHLETRKRHGRPVQPWKFFELLWQELIRSRKGFVLLAHQGGEYIGGMLYLAWGETLIAKYAASRQDRFNLRPNNLLFWEGICWGCQNGYTVFDMGRTEVENIGLRNFKSRWGAIEQPLYYSVLSKKQYQPWKGRLEQFLRGVIKRSPLWACRLSGELLYRYVG